VEAFDEDAAREKPNGLRVLHLTRHFIEVDGDFAAGQEGVRSLLRLIEHEGTDEPSGAASYLLRRNTLPVASPVVSLAHALCAAATTDGTLFLSLRHLTTEWAFQGNRRGFKDLTIDQVPCPQADALCTCLSGLAHGIPVTPESWVQHAAIEDLSTLVCRITIAYALRGFEFPEAISMIYQGHHGRVAPGPNFIGPDGPIQDYEHGRWPPDLWFNCMHMVAGLASPHFQQATKMIPGSLPDHERLFKVADDGNVRSIEQVKHLADLATTIWKGVMWAGPISVRNEAELAEIRAHVRQRKEVAEDALAKLKRCVQDERSVMVQSAKKHGELVKEAEE
jgi:hypothetical protein